MSKWTFFGKIDPERVPITLPTAVEGNAESNLGLNAKFRIAVHHQQIVIDETDAGQSVHASQTF